MAEIDYIKICYLRMLKIIIFYLDHLLLGWIFGMLASHLLGCFLDHGDVRDRPTIKCE